MTDQSALLVRVKPLVWKEIWQFVIYGEQLFGATESTDTYSISRDPWRGWEVRGIQGVFDSFDEAKAAAQADYEARIRDAIEPVTDAITTVDTPHDPVEAIVFEALVAAGVEFVRETDPRAKSLDFYLPEIDLHIEVKRFHTDRVLSQMRRANNIWVIVGLGAAKAFAQLMGRGVAAQAARDRRMKAEGMRAAAEDCRQHGCTAHDDDVAYIKGYAAGYLSARNQIADSISGLADRLERGEA